MSKSRLGLVEDANGHPVKFPVRSGPWSLDDDDLLLIALLQDPIYATELLWQDPTNKDYGRAHRWRDYQYPLCRPRSNYQGHATARNVGKTYSIQAKAFIHAFRRHGDAMLLGAPELIHLLPLTDAVEARIRDCRLTRDFLDTRGGQTGFTHRPFGVNYLDGTKIYGRIPRLTGTGFKGMHESDMILDEAQDLTERAWTEAHETVSKDVVDPDGNPDFHYEYYGVHSGARDTGFFKRSAHGGFDIVQITAMQRPSWSAAEKEAAKAAYGGTDSPDYRRNVLGEPGAAASVYFVISRLVACVDQNRESRYNQHEYAHRELRAEEVAAAGVPIAELLDLPAGLKDVYAGADLGLTNSPTEIVIFHEGIFGTGKHRERRLKLVRRYRLQRFRQREIVETWLAIGYFYGAALQGFGIDSTGLGFPIVQAMEDDQAAPAHLLDVTRGYFFNAKVPVAVDQRNVSKDRTGQMRDQYGSAVRLEVNPLTGAERYVTYMPMIEASTRYLREWVDTTFLLLPFDTEITTDMMAETQQRVRRVGELRKKPNSFHTLDSMRAMAMVYKADEIESVLLAEQRPVLDIAFAP